ncbi:MAG: hypothetical protein GF315_09775 [candidate division Zixibacteria bacterium]|nr:hypothetical protein [candidate division Zixibacteria bacterium]
MKNETIKKLICDYIETQKEDYPLCENCERHMLNFAHHIMGIENRRKIRWKGIGIQTDLKQKEKCYGIL